jgi:hypothetical protein
LVCAYIRFGELAVIAEKIDKAEIGISNAHKENLGCFRGSDL